MNPVKRKTSKPQGSLGFWPGGLLEGGGREEFPRKRWKSHCCEGREGDWHSGRLEWWKGHGFQKEGSQVENKLLDLHTAVLSSPCSIGSSVCLRKCPRFWQRVKATEPDGCQDPDQARGQWSSKEPEGRVLLAKSEYSVEPWERSWVRSGMKWSLQESLLYRFPQQEGEQF